MQTQFTDDGEAVGPTGWFESRREDYARVRERLAGVRAVTLRGDIERAAENLEKSYLFAVMSIQTERDRHERAFTRYCAGDADLREACLETVYGGQKADWITRTQESTDWESVVRAVRAHVDAGSAGGVSDGSADSSGDKSGADREALLAMCANLTGVAFRKWAFTLAMAGVWEVCCIDSNVGRALGISGRAVESPDKADASDYVRLCERVREAVDADVPPFLAQWAIYDFERGEHARHMAFFREVNGAFPNQD